MMQKGHGPSVGGVHITKRVRPETFWKAHLETAESAYWVRSNETWVGAYLQH
jgi:hypothetical protein